MNPSTRLAVGFFATASLAQLLKMDVFRSERLPSVVVAEPVTWVPPVRRIGVAIAPNPLLDDDDDAPDDARVAEAAPNGFAFFAAAPAPNDDCAGVADEPPARAVKDANGFEDPACFAPPAADAPAEDAAGRFLRLDTMRRPDITALEACLYEPISSPLSSSCAS